jgi:hypothetical protein
MSTTKPTIADVIRRAVDAGLARVHTSLPGVVTAYDRETQKASVRPAVRTFYRDEDGALQAERLPIIPSVPVQWPAGSSGSLTIDLEIGDPVTIVFSERSTDEWRAVGGDDVTPQDVRRFSLGDCVAIPGAYPFSGPLPAEAYAAGASVLRGDDVRLGDSTAADYVALDTPVGAALAIIDTVISSWVPAPGDGGAALQLAWAIAIGAAYPGGYPGQIAATKVKAK